jgi:hypothetical protein
MVPSPAGDLEVLATVDRPALAARWQQAFGCPAPRRCESTLLRGAIAWHLQMQALRKSMGRRAADRMVRTTKPTRQTLPPGTRLVREWQDRTHHVSVLADGFEHDGRTYRSLSAIARHITGTPWSGPLFFGLK